MICPEPEATELDCEFPFHCGLGTGVIVSLALVVVLRFVCCTGAEPAALWVGRVRLNHRRDVGVEGSGVGGQGLGSSCRIPGSPIVSLIGSLVGLWMMVRVVVSIGGYSSLIGKDLGNAGGWDYVAGQSDRLQIVVNLGQINVMLTLFEIVLVKGLSDRRRRISVVSRDPSFSISLAGERLDVTVHVLYVTCRECRSWES